MKLVESEQFWKVSKGLVAYSVNDLISLLNFVNDVVADLGVLSKSFKCLLMINVMMLVI